MEVIGEKLLISSFLLHLLARKFIEQGVNSKFLTIKAVITTGKEFFVFFWRMF
jgi:hypothetical protein